MWGRKMEPFQDEAVARGAPKAGRGTGSAGSRNAGARAFAGDVDHR